MDGQTIIMLVAIFVLPLYPILWKVYYKIGKLEGRMNERTRK